MTSVGRSHVPPKSIRASLDAILRPDSPEVNGAINADLLSAVGTRGIGRRVIFRCQHR